MEEQPGILQALWRFVTFYRVRKALGLVRAANKQFTGSTSGIRDAFDIEVNQKVQEYKQLESAVAEVENVIETKRLELERLNSEEKDLLKKRRSRATPMVLPSIAPLSSASKAASTKSKSGKNLWQSRSSNTKTA